MSIQSYSGVAARSLSDPPSAAGGPRWTIYRHHRTKQRRMNDGTGQCRMLGIDGSSESE